MNEDGPGRAAYILIVGDCLRDGAYPFLRPDHGGRPTNVGIDLGIGRNGQVLLGIPNGHLLKSQRTMAIRTHPKRRVRVRRGRR